MKPSQATISQLISILTILIPDVSCRFVRFTWQNALKKSAFSYADIYDVNPAWMNTKCLNLPTPDPERGLIAVEYYSGPPINPYHPYLLKTIIIFNALDCPSPSADLRWHSLQLENLDESKLPKHRRPKWLQTPNAQCLDLHPSGKEEPGVLFSESWEDMPKPIVPADLEREPHWIDYSNSEAYSIDFEKMRTGVSRSKGEEYIDELAKSLQNGQEDRVYENLAGSQEYMEDPLWNIVYIITADGEKPFLGNVSALFVPDYRHVHVMGVAREFDDYAKIGEGVGGWEPPTGWKEETKMEDEGLTEMGSPGWNGEEG
ncbi:hypothetical protein TWF506_001885 [Arthrobotrys conoides]|uniref:F-box domain-containing protein n=1 Tax=Arthrobotrys conoides TaxID=74498 RepID=A0AAN8PAH0_9PEZI